MAGYSLYLDFPTLIRKIRFNRPFAGIDMKIFEVQSVATGDGVYNCYEQTLDATEWEDTDGDSKIDDLNETSIEVLNLAEFDPEATYIAHLAAGDLIAAWQMTDDEGTKRWIGVPFRQVNADRVRRAKIQTGGVGASTLTVKLLGSDGLETGDNITVYPIEHLGINDLSGDVWPDLVATDIISCFKDVNGVYYTTFVFDDKTVC